MNRVFVHGWGAISPAGWGTEALLTAAHANTPLPVGSAPDAHGIQRPCRRVPAASPKPAWMAQPRLRRSSVISHFTVGAALEALAQAESGPGGTIDRTRLGVIFNAFGGSVIYSRRFFEEVLQTPEQASPLLFPETVFNAPASHLGAVLGTTAPNHTLVGDQTGFLLGLALAADWLANAGLDACVVVGAEEWDWSTSEAARLFDGSAVLSEGAGALVVRSQPGPVELLAITDPVPFVHRQKRSVAVAEVASQLAPWGASKEVTRNQLEPILGDGLAAAGAWGCVVAAGTIAGVAHEVTAVSLCGANLQAMGAIFGPGLDSSYGVRREGRKPATPL